MNTNKFDHIDKLLTKLADTLQARLIKDRPNYPEALRTFEERRIDWVENQIHKAIIIQPTFKRSEIDLSSWNLINIAWFDDMDSIKRLRWQKTLVHQDKFEVIENNIDQLLKESEINLKNINLKDLKPFSI